MYNLCQAQVFNIATKINLKTHDHSVAVLYTAKTVHLCSSFTLDHYQQETCTAD
jgi:hypothetical protein